MARRSWTRCGVTASSRAVTERGSHVSQLQDQDRRVACLSLLSQIDPHHTTQLCRLQLLKLATYTDDPNPAVTRILFTHNDMLARR